MNSLDEGGDGRASTPNPNLSGGSRPGSALSVSGSGWESSSSSSDEAEMAGSPKRSRAERRKPTHEQILSSSAVSAGYNIIFQVLTRVFTFCLNAFILRYVTHEVLGVCNVRLALLHSSITFLSREPFRRATLRKKEEDKWEDTVNLIWLAVPVTAFWSLIFGYIWCYVLSNPGATLDSSIASQYRSAVWLIAASLVFDAISEVPYILGQYFMFSKLRIVGDTSLILVRSLFLCFAVIFSPTRAVWAYAVGSFWGMIVVCVIYYGYFYYYISKVGKGEELPFRSVRAFLPTYGRKDVGFPWELTKLAWSFFQQGILKQLLTEGERYLMTFFDILAFDEQGIYDLVANLGSLAARFVFLPIEESAYFYFAQTLERRESFSRREKKLAGETASILGNLVKTMLLIGLVMLVYGIPYSNTLLFLYGGSTLSDASSTATKLLQANCAYIFLLALNGVTEAFTFAAMTQAQLDKFNRKLVIFSGIFLFASYVFTALFGALGFFVANSLNMALRILQSVSFIKNVFIFVEVNPFQYWKIRRNVFLYFVAAFALVYFFTAFIYINRLVHVAFGVAIFFGNLTAIYIFDRELIQFFIKLFKTKTV